MQPNSKNTEITLLVVILHNADRLPELLKTWRNIGIPGSTILPSAGSFAAENWVKRSGLSSFFSLFDQNMLQQRTLLSLIDDAEILEQAVAEAIQIIEEGYQSVACRGFSAFMLDGRAPDPGPEGVLLSLAGIVKAREREKYRASLIARILDPLDWDERVRATARLRSLLSERLPEDVRCQTAGILATAFRDLLDLRVGVMDELSRMGSALSTD